MAVHEANRRAVLRYGHAPLSGLTCTVDLFGSEPYLAQTPQHQLARWSALAQGQVRVHRVPGTREDAAAGTALAAALSRQILLTRQP